MFVFSIVQIILFATDVTMPLGIGMIFFNVFYHLSFWMALFVTQFAVHGLHSIVDCFWGDVCSSEGVSGNQSCDCIALLLTFFFNLNFFFCMGYQSACCAVCWCLVGFLWFKSDWKQRFTFENNFEFLVQLAFLAGSSPRNKISSSCCTCLLSVQCEGINPFLVELTSDFK